MQADSLKTIINRNIYGHFAEHLGHCIYGGFYVGENNKQIPNTQGIRNDVVDALRKLKIPVLRWPGGCFADTYHSASKDKNGLTHISLVNIDAKQAQSISMNIEGGRYQSVTGRILVSEKIQDHNTFDAPEKIKPLPFKNAGLKDSILTITLPPCSVVVLELK